MTVSRDALERLREATEDFKKRHPTPTEEREKSFRERILEILPDDEEEQAK